MEYNDDSEVVIVCEEDPDEPGIDVHEVLNSATDEEVELGEFLGAMIDIDDDESNGSEWAGVTAEELQAMAAANEQP